MTRCLHDLDEGTCAWCLRRDLRDVEAMGDFVALGFTPFAPTPSAEAPRTGQAAFWRPGGGGGCPSSTDGTGRVELVRKLVGWRTTVLPYQASLEDAWRKVQTWNAWLVNDVWFDPSGVESTTV